jgi:hypothetical protein
MTTPLTLSGSFIFNEQKKAAPEPETKIRKSYTLPIQVAMILTFFEKVKSLDPFARVWLQSLQEVLTTICPQNIFFTIIPYGHQKK